MREMAVMLRGLCLGEGGEWGGRAVPPVWSPHLRCPEPTPRAPATQLHPLAWPFPSTQKECGVTFN